MTIYEHLKYIAEVKQVPKDQLEREISYILKKTNLEKDKNKLVE